MEPVWYVVMPSGARWGVTVETRAEAQEMFDRMLLPLLGPEERGDWKLLHRDEVQKLPDRCDFCLGHAPEWVLTSKEFTLPGPPKQVISPEWLACGGCKKLAEARRWTDMVARITAANLLLHPDWEPAKWLIVESFREMLARFSEGWDGAAEPNPKVEKDT